MMEQPSASIGSSAQRDLRRRTVSPRPSLPAQAVHAAYRALEPPRGWHGIAAAGAFSQPVDEAGDEFAGIWVSAGGSIYAFDGIRFVCLAVHSPVFRGWIGMIAVDQVRRVGTAGSGLQAMRCKATGKLGNWEPVDLEFDEDVITKHFPPHVPAARLVYGHTERYFRVRSSGWAS